MAFNLKLPDERGRQLQLIAEAEGKTIVEVISDHIRSKIEAGVIPADVPGVVVDPTPDGLALALPGFRGFIPKGEVPTLTGVLRRAGMKLSADEVTAKQELLEALAALSGIKVKRMAQGVKLISPITGQEYPLAFGVAEDLAEQIDRSAS